MKSKKVNVLKFLVPVMVVLALVLGACTSSRAPTTTSSSTSILTQTTPPLTTTTTTTQTSQSTSAKTTTSTQTLSSYAINVVQKTGVGNYLADSRGMTLYITARDTIGKSNITGETLANWPVFYAPSI
jgi:hypothetical protein